MANDYPCKDCSSSTCADCQNEEGRKFLDTSILREQISRLDSKSKIPFIEGVLREEGLEPL